MEDAAHYNSSLLKIFLVILYSFVEQPVVDVKHFAELTLWTGGASEPWTAAPNETFPTLKVWAYCPGAIVIFNKEVAISWGFQFKNLWKNKGV